MTVVVLARQVAGDREAERRRDRGRGVRGAERVVFALGALGEAGQARRPGAGCGCGRAGRSGSCADRPGGRRPRSGCRWASRTRGAGRRSARPRPGPAPRWPPVTETASMVSARSSSASWRRRLGSNRRKSSGVRIWSSRGVFDGWYTGFLRIDRVGRSPRQCGKSNAYVVGSNLFRVHAPNGLKHIAGERQFT